MNDEKLKASIVKNYSDRKTIYLGFKEQLIRDLKNILKDGGPKDG